MKKKTVGIIGGMGPLATADLFKKIIENTEAESDGEHLRILLDNNTAIPDRTAAILGRGRSPVPKMRESALSLWAMGAELLVMPCNTAHHFHAEVQAAVGIPLLHMIDLTRDALVARGVRTVGLLATEGTVKSGIYAASLRESGLSLLLPDERGQRAITDLIYNGVKAGRQDHDIAPARAAMEDLLSRGAELLLLGCTELPVAVERYDLRYPTCDPTLELAKATVRLASRG
ncbi:MAG: amino acid racemase [Clostridia bacterium]|nr:amino acid racemase [Clostridia bacterium]